ncbi:Uncharacterised protein [Mycobacteroides abscessus subsp. abscessus]|nr:Uncharacterised protein [Mycobacteroides abscessus subsp. abscessus]
MRGASGRGGVGLIVLQHLGGVGVHGPGVLGVGGARVPIPQHPGGLLLLAEGVAQDRPGLGGLDGLLLGGAGAVELAEVEQLGLLPLPARTLRLRRIGLRGGSGLLPVHHRPGVGLIRLVGVQGRGRAGAVPALLPAAPARARGVLDVGAVQIGAVVLVGPGALGPLPEQPGQAGAQPRDDLAHGGRGDDQQGDDQQQHVQGPRPGHGEQLGHGAPGQQAHDAAGLADRQQPVVGGRRARGEVEDRGAGDHHQQQPDGDAVVGAHLGGVAEGAQAESAQQDGGEQGHQPEGPGDHGVPGPGRPGDGLGGGPGEVPPLDGGGDQGQQQHQQGAAVAPVLRVQLGAQGAHAPHGPADEVGQAQPGGAERPHQGVGAGAGLLGCAGAGAAAAGLRRGGLRGAGGSLGAGGRGGGSSRRHILQG